MLKKSQEETCFTIQLLNPGSHKLYAMKLQDISKDDFWVAMLAACECGTHMATTTKIDQNHTDTILDGQSPQSVN